MKPYTGGIVMPQNAETLVRKKHERIMDNILFNDIRDGHIDLKRQMQEYKRWTKELDTIDSPHIDRRPKK